MKKFFLLSVLLTVGFFSALNAQYAIKLPKSNWTNPGKVLMIPVGQDKNGPDVIKVNAAPVETDGNYVFTLTPAEHTKLKSFLNASPTNIYEMWMVNYPTTNTAKAIGQCDAKCFGAEQKWILMSLVGMKCN